jgi:Domain of unknown function (DUF4389)
MAINPGTAALLGSGQPVSLRVIDEREMNRLWGIPIVGIAVRAFLAIPHALVLMILGIGMNAWIFLGWIPILLNGRVPAVAVKFLIEYLHRYTRIAGYVACLMPGGYPPLEPGAPNPIDLQISLEGLAINRWWGIPLFGLLVRVLVVLPQIIVLSLLWTAVALTWLVLWIPILASGRYPEWAVHFYQFALLYTARVGAYVMFLPVPYPPIWLA